MITSRSLNSTIDRMLTLNHVLDEALSGARNGGSTTNRVWVPAVDVIETRDAYLLAFEVPGIDPSSLDIGFEQNVLTVRGAKPLGFELDGKSEVRVHAAERVSGNFERAVRLPEFVDSENIVADHRHGVLFLTVPKAQAARAKKIAIRGVDAKQIEN